MYYCNDDFITVDNPKIWYFLGIFASDGNIYVTQNIERIQFCMKDKEILEYIIDILGYSGVISSITRNNRNYYQLMISYPPLNIFVKNIFGEVYRKTSIIKFPSIHNKKHLQLFLRGYMDGDGCFRKTKMCNTYHLTLYCDSTKFANSLYKILKYITKSHVGLYKCYWLELTSNKANTLFYNFLYQDYLEIGLKRKSKRALQHILKYKN